MKIYFDTLADSSSNHKNLETNSDNNYWLVAPGAPIKQKCMEMHLDVSELTDVNEKGIYFVDVRGDPNWWSGVLNNNGVPKEHILRVLSKSLLDKVRQGKIRLIICADREGGPMITKDWDCFLEMHNAMIDLELPINSVLLTQGNKKIERQYKQWLSKNKLPRMYEVMYSNHFGKIFWDEHNVPSTPLILKAIEDKNSKSFNSLNRVYRPQRGAHLYRCIKDNILDDGIISGNQIHTNDEETKYLCGENYAEIKKHFPKFIDGDWSKTNAANQFNEFIYTNSLMTVITETMFIPDVAFITEKIFKPMTLGHPLILFASQGTLAAVKELGFRIDWCGINPKYNDITDPIERFNATQQVLVDWVNLSREEKIFRINESMDVIEHNFNLMRSRDFYKEAIMESIVRSREYFNESI